MIDDELLGALYGDAGPPPASESEGEWAALEDIIEEPDEVRWKLLLYSQHVCVMGAGQRGA